MLDMLCKLGNRLVHVTVNQEESPSTFRRWGG